MATPAFQTRTPTGLVNSAVRPCVRLASKVVGYTGLSRNFVLPMITKLQADPNVDYPFAGS
jgi:hypothetical protein